jgi:kynurenine formamidase
MKQTITACVTILLLCNGCNNKEQSLSETLSKGKWIDLSYDLSAQTLYWPNNPTGFKLDTTAIGITQAGFYYSTYAFSAPEHGGTHLDAPSHFAEHGISVDKISLDQLTGDAIVVDVSDKALKNRDYLISVDDITNWEKENGNIVSGTIILFKTGYGKFYPDAEKYFGTAQKGTDAIPLLHFPGIDSTTAAWIVQHKIKAVGIDTPSIDFGQSMNFKTHEILMGAGIPAFENVANLTEVPAKGAYIIALPMKIKNGSGGPLRLIAWVKQV